MNAYSLNRRAVLRKIVTATGVIAIGNSWQSAISGNKRKYRISVYDWSISKQSEVMALTLAIVL